jgi:hypothetical protein
MPDFGIGEAIAAISAFAAEGAADVGAVGAGLAGAAETGLGAVGAGLGELGGSLGGLFGEGAGGLLGGAEGTSALAGEAAINPLADLGAAGLTAPAAGGAAPAGAGAIDLASTAGAGNITAFAPDFAATQDAITAGIFDPIGANSTAFAPAASGGSTGLVGGGTDLASLTGGVTGGGTDLTALTGGGGGGLPVTAGAVDPMASAAGGGGGFMNNLASSALSSLTKNPLGIAAAGAGLGYNLLQGSKTSQNEQNVQNIANNMAGQGAQLQQYLQNGTLPPGMQAGLDNAKAAAKAQIVSGYAARGQPSDPNLNSALAQELAAVDTNSLELQGKIATNLLQAGINETNMSADLFKALIQMDATQAKSMGAAISNFATSLAGGPKAIVIGGGASA